MNDLKKEIPEIHCKLEKLFPPAFFDVMMHLPIHLPEEALLRGPVSYGWVFPVERRLGYLKRTVCNKERPEGSIAEMYIVDESSTFISRYFKDDMGENVGQKDKKVEPREGELGIFSCDVHGIGKKKLHNFNWPGDMAKIHRYILDNCPEVEPYME